MFNFTSYQGNGKLKEKGGIVLYLLISIYKVTVFKCLQSFGEVGVSLYFR